MNDKHPLFGLKVLDFSRVLAGPFAGRMLSDLGAEVVKIEPPDGDITRMWGKDIGGLPGYYFQQNAGKRNISIDLRSEGAKELVLELACEADIIIENYRPDVMPRLGLGYEQIREVNPRIVMLSISGFGKEGPESHRPAYAPIIHAEAGLMHRQAERANLSHSDLPLSVADTNASLHGLVGLLSAIIMRERTGVGQHIDIAMIDSTLATDDQLHYALDDSEDTAPLKNDVWETGAGPIFLSADFRYVWKLLTEASEVVDPTTKYTPLEEKISARRSILAEYLRTKRTWDEVEYVMARMNLAWGKVLAPETLREQPTIAARGSIVELDDRAGGTRPIAQSPYRFSNAESGVRGPAPHKGEHSFEVLEDWLGKSNEETQDLIERGVIWFDG